MLSFENYHLLPCVRADLLAKLGYDGEAQAEWQRAAPFTGNARERELLLGRAKAARGPLIANQTEKEKT